MSWTMGVKIANSVHNDSRTVEEALIVAFAFPSVFRKKGGNSNGFPICKL